MYIKDCFGTKSRSKDYLFWNNIVNEKKEEKSILELQEEIKQLKKRIKELERERDILLALHRRDIE